MEHLQKTRVNIQFAAEGFPSVHWKIRWGVDHPHRIDLAAPDYVLNVYIFLTAGIDLFSLHSFSLEQR